VYDDDDDDDDNNNNNNNNIPGKHENMKSKNYRK